MEIFSYSEDYIEHAGVAHDENPPGRGSGRYPFGQGNRPHQHDWDLYARITKLEQKGMSEAEIAKALGMTTKDVRTGVEKPSSSQLRAEKAIAVNNMRADKHEELLYYESQTNEKTGKKYTDTEIAQLMGLPGESSVRSIRKTATSADNNPLFQCANKIKEISKEKGIIDVGEGNQYLLGVSKTRFDVALEVLKKDGYKVEQIFYKNNMKNAGDKWTTVKALIPPNEQKGLYDEDGNVNKKKLYDKLVGEGKVNMIADIDGTSDSATLKGWQDPRRVDLSRVKIKYDEDGGTAMDGTIEIRAKIDPKTGKYIPACEDLSLGNYRYGQVRIAVDVSKEGFKDENGNLVKTRYAKGMAIYNPNLPEGTDILINSNKPKEKGPMKALKEYKENELNPFGAQVVQTNYIDKNGKEQLSAINFVGSYSKEGTKVNAEGAWGDWGRNMASQFLSKQNYPLVKKQLSTHIAELDDQLEDIMKMKNPVIRAKLLKDYSETADKSAADLKAAPLPGQKTHVILPSTTLKDNEIYAPDYANGQILACVRFPHAGPFEIPLLKVNNNNKECKDRYGNALDAVAFNGTVANKLSGADFDGDNVVVIPVTRKASDGSFVKAVDIKATDTLPGLVNFSTDDYSRKNFPTYKNKEFVTIDEKSKQRKMGEVSNMITDMYAKGCDDVDHLTRAVKFSMIIIDAKKHDLNWQQAYDDLGILELQKKYQGRANNPNAHGAASILSRAKNPMEVDWYDPKRDTIDPETGKKVHYYPENNKEVKREPVRAEAPEGYKYRDAEGNLHRSKYFRNPDGSYVTATYKGKVVKTNDETGFKYVSPKDDKQVWQDSKPTDRKMQVKRMDAVDDARELLSDNPNAIERAYATYANHCKNLANQARKAEYQAENFEKYKVDPDAKKEYKAEIDSLDRKLIDAKKNTVRERNANLITTSRMNAYLKDHPNLDKDSRMKIQAAFLKQARIDMEAERNNIVFTQKEYEAIEKHAVSPSKLKELLNYADKDSYLQYAMPKYERIPATKKSRIKALYNAGYSQEEIAKMVDGVSQSSISDIITKG